MNNCLILREFRSTDTELFKTWLYSEHAAKWYEHPSDWIDEIENRKNRFSWIHHFIAEYNGVTIGFCQYYEYCRGGETWHGTADISGAYGIDYLIGNPDYLGKKLGTAMLRALIALIRTNKNAKLVIVQPDPNNTASINTLLSVGFEFDTINRLYRLPL